MFIILSFCNKPSGPGAASLPRRAPVTMTNNNDNNIIIIIDHININSSNSNSNSTSNWPSLESRDK